jgi:hypothetical protein
LEALRGEGGRKEQAMIEAAQALEKAYAWLEERLAGQVWAVGDSQPRRLCGRSCLVLCGLGPCDRPGVSHPPGL